MHTPDISAAKWRKSSYSGPNGGQCVELADLPHVIAVRDSKNRDHPALTFNRTTFTTLLRAL
ncbi:DUF397 domain-containing protein [Actinocorallia sp. API 0066]|uniref:DUF397 domain-containing protein n=1 Tax=Actinocorallia sp. API 0066 TaxID=2896846 RepID=UPI001E564F6E|nr:DUF397 domain-containing protein [Actinocorallia sp. API 0066]MCD0448137.1 DUF397 domain-containing protein [Actinocorallia sp. API 0066]